MMSRAVPFVKMTRENIDTTHPCQKGTGQMHTPECWRVLYTSSLCSQLRWSWCAFKKSGRVGREWKGRTFDNTLEGGTSTSCGARITRFKI